MPTSPVQAYKNGLRAQQAPRVQPSDMRARLEASPPDAKLVEELDALQDPSVREALLFALYSYSGSEWSGEIVFVVGEGASCFTATFSLSPAGPKLRCTPGRTTRAHPHVVTCGQQVPLAARNKDCTAHHGASWSK